MKRISRDTGWLFVMFLSVALYAFASRPAGRWAGEGFDPGPPPHPRVAGSAVPSERSRAEAPASPVPSEESRVVSRADRDAAFKGEGLTDVRIAPDLRAGKPFGSRVVSVSSSSLFSKMGLRQGDVILSVNGHPARTVEDALAVHRSLAGDPQIVFEVERGGRLQRLHVLFR